ncbi:MAG TPA: hypothetical protein VEB22_11255 [Phycisphaerales bacterium]|nr:hypothetical protein [Phycisphaerales bacterium]
MSRTWVGALAFIAGAGSALLAVKLYKDWKVRSGVHDALNAVGLAGGTVEEVTQTIAGRLL